MTAGVPWRARDGGVEIAVRLTPRSSRDAVEAVRFDASGRPSLAVRVRAVPEDGAANRAACAAVAGWLGVPKSAVRVTAGATRRDKTLVVAGDAADLLAALEWLARPAAG
ncbi:MAG: DUF167 domain-containing protein [Rhizobiaceae bacterium]|nr:DUF167 domain-containing protein [Rhizobiaceae bacterium]